MNLTEKGMEKRIMQGKNAIRSRAPYRDLSTWDWGYFFDKHVKRDDNGNVVSVDYLGLTGDLYYFGISRGIEISKMP